MSDLLGMRYLTKHLSVHTVALFLLFSFPAVAQQGQVDYYQNTPDRSTIPTNEEAQLKGQELFRGHCAECHRLDRQEVGPALASVTDRRPVSWLLAWIQNSQQVIKGGDAYANYLFESYNGTVMPSFDYLSEEDKLAILSYIKKKSAQND